ncbi:MAG: TolC family protein [Spirochaetaceae bacterium]|nr:TolC family protein [Spirochaetaceae bacterium]
MKKNCFLRFRRVCCCAALVFVCSAGTAGAQDAEDATLNKQLSVEEAEIASTQDETQVAGLVSAQHEVEKRHLSVEEAVSLASAANLGLEANKVDLSTKKRAATLFWNQFLPVVGLATATGVRASNTTTYPDGSPWTISAGVQIQWTQLNLAMFQGIKTIRDQYAAGLLTFNKAQIQLERDVRKLYLQILLQEETLKVQQENLSLANQRVDVASSRYRAGLSPELTLLQARVTRDNLIPTMEQVRDSIKTLMSNFAVLLGLPYDTEFALDSVEFGNFDIPLDVQELVLKASEGKPDIIEMRGSIIAAKSARKAQAYLAWTPSITLGWGYVPTYADPNPSVLPGKWTDQGAFSVGLSWNINGLLPFTTQGNAIRDLDDNITKLNISLAQMIQGTEAEIYSKVFTLRQAEDSIRAQQRTVDLAMRSSQLTTQAFQAGLQDLIQVQDAQNQLSQSQLGLAQKQFDFLLGTIDLEYSLGVPFGRLGAP